METGSWARHCKYNLGQLSLEMRGGMRWERQNRIWGWVLMSPNSVCYFGWLERLFTEMSNIGTSWVGMYNFTFNTTSLRQWGWKGQSGIQRHGCGWRCPFGTHKYVCDLKCFSSEGQCIFGALGSFPLEGFLSKEILKEDQQPED